MLRADEGATAIEYVGVLLLVAAIVVGLISLGIPGSVRREVRTAMCEIFGGRCRSSGGHRALDPRRPASSPEPPDTPAPSRTGSAVPPQPAQPPAAVQAPPCVRSQSRDETAKSRISFGYRHDWTGTWQVQTKSDGSVVESRAEQGGNGAQVDVGGKVKVLKGLGLDGGFGAMWNSKTQSNLTFKNENQRIQYHQRVKQELRKLNQEVKNDPQFTVKHPKTWSYLKERRKEIPEEVALDLGIPSKTYTQKGQTTNFGSGADYAVGGASGTKEDSQAAMKGQARDDNGTADPRDDITSEIYQNTPSKWTGRADVGANPLRKLMPRLERWRAGPEVYGEYWTTENYEIQWQYGRPKKLIMTTSQVGGFEYGVGVDAKLRKGAKSGSSGMGTMTKGEGKVEQRVREIDLTRAPAARAAFLRYWRYRHDTFDNQGLNPAENKANQDFQWYLDHYGTDTRQTY